MPPRILFVLKYRDNKYSCDPPYSYTGGLSSGLLNSARFVCDMLAANGFPTKLVQVLDNNYIHREAVAFQADIVIIEAFWVVPSKFDELKRVLPKVKWIVRNHSDLPFLSNEGIGMEWALDYIQKDNVYFGCNASATLQEFRFLAGIRNPLWSKNQIEKKVAFLPNFYPIPAFLPGKFHNPDETLLDIGCFGAIRPLKNQLLQAVAALKFAHNHFKRLRFHINGSRIEMNGSAILKNIIGLFDREPDDELVMHPWVDHDKFLVIMRQMDMCMQVSFSETFNIVAADAVTSNVPVVVSKEIHWVDKRFQADPTSSSDIVKKMEAAMLEDQQFPFRKLNLQGLKAYNDRSEEAYVNYLSSL